MPIDRERVESVFEAALELAPERRHEFVVAACGSSEAMRAAVLKLLAAHARAAGVLDVEPDALFSEQPPPERIGVYRLLGEIGRGGMGVVYDAERDDGQFRRRVAIKIIRQGSDPELLERMNSERQILAGLDHPNIARLLDGGVTSDGRPYLVMEHVDGLPIDVYCERMRLTVAERLELFTAVARAVDFAHRNLVVHRDLKPSNILVTADGRAKLLDFGVARLLHPWLSSDAPVARERDALTPEYASPEQLRGESLTTTTDVYSLGVVLYELLVGRRPHEEHEHSAAQHAAAVCDGEIEPASRRATRAQPSARKYGSAGSSDPAAVARQRQTTPQRLAKQLAGDVDAILERALAVAPPRRYSSAEILAQDIEAHLAHRPLVAYSGGRGHALVKLVRRHRLQAAAVAVTALAVLFGAGAAAWQATVARAERQRAELALQDAEDVTEFLLGLFDAGEQPQIVSVRDLLDRGMARIDQLGARPDVQARVLGAMGAIHESTGEYEEGQRATERALAMMREHGNAESGQGARLLLQLGILQRRRGEYDSAQATFMQAREIQDRVLDPADPARSLTFKQLASIAVYRRDLPEAERRAREALDIQLRTLGPAHPMRVNMLAQLGAIQRRRGDMEGAEQTLSEAVALRPRATGSTRQDILNDRFQYATTVQADTSRQDEAEALYRAELAGLNPESPDDAPFVLWAESSLADLLARRGDLAGAEDLYRNVLDMRRRKAGSEHISTAASMVTLARLLLRTSKANEALDLMTEGAAVYRRTLGARHPVYAEALLSLSDAQLAVGDLQAADSAAAAALAIRAERLGPNSDLYNEALRTRAAIQRRMGRFATAEALLLDGLKLTDRESSARSAVHRSLAELYDAWGKTADAKRHLRMAEAPARR